LTRLESGGLGEGFRDNVLASLFNMHKITRHVLAPRGATFVSETSDLLVSDNLDFHPTDVLEDADGSIIVVDTGGWFRLCCPTSQLEKPDVLGGIYRIRRGDATPPADPRGRQLAWNDLDERQLVALLNDDRFAVRNQARQRIGKLGSRAIQPLVWVLASVEDPGHRLQAVWALTWIDDPRARAAVRAALDDADEIVRQAALHSVSLHQDTLAADQLVSLLASGSAQSRRAAAEALGRVGTAHHVAALLSAVPNAILVSPEGDPHVDRFLEHSLIYAAIELDDPDALRQSVAAAHPRIRRAALIALDQMGDGGYLRPEEIQPLLLSDDELLKETAWWIAQQHPDWGDTVAEAFGRELRQPSEGLERLGDRLARFAGAPSVQQVLASAVQDPATDDPVRLTVLHAMASSRQKPLPDGWAIALHDHLVGSHDIVRAALTALEQLGSGSLNAETVARLQRLALDAGKPAEIRLRAFHSLPVAAREMSPAMLEFVCSQLRLESGLTNRTLAVDILTSSTLNATALQRVARELPRTGTIELRPLMTMFARSSDPDVGGAVVRALLDTPAAISLFPDQLQQQLAGFGESVAARAEPLLEKIHQENQSKLERVEDILALMPTADARRGLRVFQSAKASCMACHRRGYLGGDIGPDLNRIGQIRNERDLLESILFPSLSFVRSYEPATVITEDGRVFNGIIRDETEESISLQLDAQKSLTIPASAIEERQPGTVSIMPAGLETQLTPQELADLVKYLREGG
jgi:putative heme-binding domain-containing protein